MRKRLLTAALTLALLSAPALALTLSEARQQGRVGETLNGYLAPLRQDKETLALVKQINAARSESYQQLADDNNLPVDEVAKMAGQKLVARAQPGSTSRIERPVAAQIISDSACGIPRGDAKALLKGGGEMAVVAEAPAVADPRQLFIVMNIL